MSLADPHGELAAADRSAYLSANEANHVQFESDDLLEYITGNYRLRTEDGDGNCQFSAICSFVSLPAKYCKYMRNMVCAFIEMNPSYQDLFGNVEQGSLYSADQQDAVAFNLQTCKTNGVWGNHITLIAAADMLNCCVVIWVKGTRNPAQFEVVGAPHNRIVFVAHTRYRGAGIHYDSFIRKPMPQAGL